MPTRKVLFVLVCILFTAFLSSSAGVPLNDHKDLLAFEPRRKKKHTKYVLAMILAAVLIKAVLFPLAFKTMALMAGISVILSTMSLMVSSMVGYAKTAKDSYHSYVTRRHQQQISDEQQSDSDRPDDPKFYPHGNGNYVAVGGVGVANRQIVLSTKMMKKGFKNPNH